MKKIIFVNIIIISSLIIFFEILIRSLSLVSLQGIDKGFIFSENNIILNKPNSTFLKVAGKIVKTDEKGFRIPSGGYEIKNDFKSTFILGDSVSFGFGVKEKDTFVGILREQANTNLLNSSVIGHNLKSYIYILNKYINKSGEKFEKAIIFLCLNDIHMEQGVASEDEIKKNLDYNKDSFFISFLRNETFAKINIFLREKSALFVFLKSIGTNSVKRHYEYMRKSYDDNILLTKYSNYINEIKSFSESNNLKIDFVLLPYSYQVSKNCEKQYIQPQIKVRKIFKDLNLNLYDFTDNFCSNKNGENYFLGHDPVHLSNAGHKFVSILLIENEIIN